MKIKSKQLTILFTILFLGLFNLLFLSSTFACIGTDKSCGTGVVCCSATQYCIVDSSGAYCSDVAPTSTTSASVNSIPVPIAPELSTVQGIISTLSNIIFPVVGLVLFAMIVYGGVTKLTAAGDAEKEKKAMQILKNAVIGAVIIVLARVIMDAIAAILGVPLV